MKYKRANDKHDFVSRLFILGSLYYIPYSREQKHVLISDTPSQTLNYMVRNDENPHL
jgi:hypothetical protein